MKSSNGDIIIHKTEDGLTKIDVKIENAKTEYRNKCN